MPRSTAVARMKGSLSSWPLTIAAPIALSRSVEIAALRAEPRQDRQSEPEHVRAGAELGQRHGLIQLVARGVGIVEPRERGEVAKQSDQQRGVAECGARRAGLRRWPPGGVAGNELHKQRRRPQEAVREIVGAGLVQCSVRLVEDLRPAA